MKICSILERSRHLIPIITHTYIERFSNNGEDPEFADITKKSLLFMRNYADANEFVRPIFTENESYSVKEKGREGVFKIKFDYYLNSLKENKLPVEFDGVNLYRYDVERDFTDSTKDKIWKRLIGNGKTMKELGYKL